MAACNVSTTSYTNTLHEALLAKDEPTFWKCWQSKFDGCPNCTQVNGCTKPEAIARSFVVLYADDILLIPPSVSELRELFDACVIELNLVGWT